MTDPKPRPCPDCRFRHDAEPWLCRFIGLRPQEKMRSDDGMCGPEGRLFEPRPASAPQKQDHASAWWRLW